MINRILTVFLLLSAFFGTNLSCRFKESSTDLKRFDEQSEISKEEYVIFKVLLKDERKSLVVFDNTHDETFGVDQDFFKKEFPDIQFDTLENYIERNRKPPMMTEPPIGFDFQVVNKTDVKQRLERESQYYEFSRVGFSKDRQQALVYFEDNCKAQCGKGSYYILKKEGNSWKVAKESEAWMS
jgi:hypothetical protein